jgi:hypothetical protein
MQTVLTENLSSSLMEKHLSLFAKPRTLIQVKANQVSIDLLWCELQFTPEHAEQIAKLLFLCDGNYDIATISKMLNWSSEKTLALITHFYVRGVLVDDAYQSVSAQLCQEHLVSWGRTLRARMSAAMDLLGNNLHQRRLLGSLVETYHFVSAASFHIGAALAHAPNAIIRDGLSQLFVDEWKHGRDLRRGLLAAGLNDREIDNSLPLPQTTSVINYLRTLASTDLLSYGVCAAINESPKSDTAIKETWDKIAQMDLLPREAIKPFRGHELEDEASDHRNISDLLFSDHSIISPIQQKRIQQHVVTFIATQRACYQALKQYYQEEQGSAVFEVNL